MSGHPDKTAKDAILHAWDNLDRAASAVWSAQTWQLTAAVESLEKARISMRDAIMKWGCGND